MSQLAEEKRRCARSLLLRYCTRCRAQGVPLPGELEAVAFGYQLTDEVIQVAGVALSINGRTRLACAVEPDGKLRDLPKYDWPPDLYFARN